MRTWIRSVVEVLSAHVGFEIAGADAATRPSIPFPILGDVTAAEWRRLAGRRVFFGHQSVGGDILDGVAVVLREHPEIELRVVETADPSQMNEAGVFHARIGRNCEPRTKLDSFVAIVSSAGAELDVALLKYCYVDVTADTDPMELFESYCRAVEALQAVKPGLIVLHLTLPLQTDWGEYFHWKRVIRGRLATHRELNSIRHAYNERLRRAYLGREPIFDLAHWQSIGPDGRMVTVRHRRTRVPVLARAWTSDGGHLNEDGRRRIAGVFLVALAKVEQVKRP